MNLRLRHNNNPNIPYKVTEVLKTAAKTTNKPAAMTEPGIAYPEDDIDIINLRLFVPL